MKIKIFLLFCSSLLIYSISFSQTVDWAYRTGENGGDYPNCAIMDHAGDILSGGIYHKRVDFDPGPDSTFSAPYTTNSHMYMTKTDVNGNFTWYVSLRVDLSSYLKKIVVDADNNIYVTGMFSGTDVDFDPGPNVFYLSSTGATGLDIFVAKYDPGGSLIRAFSLKSYDSDEPYDMVLDDSCNICLTGYYGSSLYPDPANASYSLNFNSMWDYFVAKYDSAGNFRWASGTGGTYQDIGIGIATDDDGNVYTTGRIWGPNIDFDLGPGTYLFNTTTQSNMFIAKYNGVDGSIIWVYPVGGNSGGFSGEVIPFSMTRNINGNFVQCGWMAGLRQDFQPGPDSLYVDQSPSGSEDSYIAEYDSSGRCNWVKRLDALDHTNFLRIRSDNFGNIYLAGSHDTVTVDLDPGPGTANVISSGMQDMLVASYDMNGNYRWAFGAGSEGIDYSSDIVIDQASAIYLFGAITDTMIVSTQTGNDTLKSHGGFDIVCMKYAASTLGATELTGGGSFTIYPNPCSGIFNIRLDEINSQATVSVYNLTGQLLNKLCNEKNSWVEVDLALRQGIYFVQLNYADKTITKKLVVVN